ncbi:MAG TPA: aminotransferase class V-fold PLP-dependent enzyme, partial [Acidimicrobiales bacterium]|nr:aminotransferase class V-fold PLP-dependent enzyme [Acidimicrobiales bacterium]
MTVIPSPGGPQFEAGDESLVAEMANAIFREGPAVAGSAATRAEDTDALPGHAANAATDQAAMIASSLYRVNPALTDAIPFGDVPHAAPGVLGTAASSPSGFMLRSAPLGAALPAEAVEPWRFMAQQWPAGGPQGSMPAVPYGGGPMNSEVPRVEALRAFVNPPQPGSHPPLAYSPQPPTHQVDAGDAGFYFLRSPATIAPPDAVSRRPPGAGYDPGEIRRDFPVLRQRVHGKRLIWLDNAATTQKPQCVIDEIARFYQEDNSNVHRGAHSLAARATDAYEGARAKVAALLGATSTQEIIFVRGTTEAINLVAQAYGRSVVGPGDEIVLTTLEHHSNIVPWQLLAKEKGASLKPVRIDDRGDVQLDHYASLLGPRTRIVALTQVSNALGTIVPVEAMAAMAKAVGAVVVVDGAQGVPHMPVNVEALGADFYAFSGHKIYGPTGVGVLWGRRQLLETMPPWQGGGQMIKHVDFESSTWNELPYKFEAGTGT